MRYIKNITHPLTYRFLVRIVLLVVVAFIVLTGCGSVKQIKNPYSTVDWKKYGQYRANLHTHTMVSDGWINPHTVVEKYGEAGYQILAISDHNSVTWPWEEFSKFKVSGKTEKRIAGNELKPQEEEAMTPGDLDFRNVSPSDAGMVAIQANELSSHHHMNSFFSDHNGTTTEIESLEATATKNGLVILNHPGRYHEADPKHYSLEWYLDLYKRYPHLLGMEVYNCGKRFPHDDLLWDSILVVMATVRPVWGFSNDDMHSLRDFGRNWNVFLLSELNEPEVRHAMEGGTFYFVYAPDGYNELLTPVIKSVKVNQRKREIEINASKCDSIIWISGGIKIGKGNRFVLKRSQGDLNYIRAELYGADDSKVCTQPFFIEKSE